MQAEMLQSAIVGVLVLYNPDLQLLTRLLHSISNQIDRLIVIDNSIAPDTALQKVMKENVTHVLYIPLGENRGIATAQNVGIARAIELGASHVLLLDQDSAPSPTMVRAMLEAEQTLLTAGIYVGCLGPVFVDEKTGTQSPAIRHRFLHVQKVSVAKEETNPVEADYLISSGCLIRTSVLVNVGMMNDDLFIDWVDIEWGLRARAKGFKNYIVPQASMCHSIGDAAIHFMGKEINLHNETRNYYIVRNATYLLSLKAMGWNWRIITACKIPQYILFYSWHSPRRSKGLILLLCALFHGLSGRLGPIPSRLNRLSTRSEKSVH